jgi:hypothetical protein
MKLINPNGRVVSVTESMYRRYKAKIGWKPYTETQPSGFPKHTGGPWYELSDGSKVSGKENAIQAQNELV